MKGKPWSWPNVLKTRTNLSTKVGNFNKGLLTVCNCNYCLQLPWQSLNHGLCLIVHCFLTLWVLGARDGGASNFFFFLLFIYVIADFCLISYYLTSVQSQFRGSANFGAPSMENRFQVAKFFIEVPKASSLFFVWSKMTQVSLGLLVLASKSVLSGPQGVQGPF